MAEAALTPMTVDLEPVQLVAADGTATTEVRYSRDLPGGTYGLLCSFGAGYSAGSVILKKVGA